MFLRFKNSDGESEIVEVTGITASSDSTSLYLYGIAGTFIRTLEVKDLISITAKEDHIIR